MRYIEPSLELSSLLGEAEPRWWVKIVDMLQQNWALPVPDESGVTVLFVGDTGGIFDQLAFENAAEMTDALRRNGFEEYARTPRVQAILSPPQFPLTVR